MRAFIFEFSVGQKAAWSKRGLNGLSHPHNSVLRGLDLALDDNDLAAAAAAAAVSTAAPAAAPPAAPAAPAAAPAAAATVAATAGVGGRGKAERVRLVQLLSRRAATQVQGRRTAVFQHLSIHFWK